MLFWTFFKNRAELLYNVTGMWTVSQVFPSVGKWIHFLVNEHPGIISFLVVDIICVSAGTTLTIAQASQVIFGWNRLFSAFVIVRLK